MEQKKKVGNYYLVEKIGQGQFGVVYKSVSIEDPKKVFAIKCVLKKNLEKNAMLTKLFQTEMSVMSKLEHPHIMHLFEFMETSNNFYLVIQYCNNGDLENYLKKMGKLSEDEAVYFLMQIMNGFQVLHRNKIMHRDVKLANLFLQDDKVVIGDFGFAKQGEDFAKTKLGTPITMAPELLISDGKGYTNKADLWSIGVCFYQILFGKTPFEAKNYDDLKEKVRVLSGNNLIFPKDVPISKECKNLLVRLLQYEAKQRIEWKEFFNHPVFELHSNYKKNNIQDISQSMFERQNEQKIKMEFMNNKIEAVDNQKFDNQTVAEKHLEIKNTEEDDIKDVQQEHIAAQFETENDLKFIRNRYIHEKKTVIFIMYTVRKLRNLAKNKSVFKNYCEHFMLASCILLKKGVILNANAINSLQNKDNFFKLKQFEKFVGTLEKTKILTSFEEDTKVYQIFHEQMNAKFAEEIKSEQFKKDMQIYDNVGYADVEKLNIVMMKLFKELKKKLDALTLEPVFESEVCLSLVHFYYSIQSNITLFFQKNNQFFEWKSFENDVHLENAKEVLQTLDG